MKPQVAGPSQEFCEEMQNEDVLINETFEFILPTASESNVGIATVGCLPESQGMLLTLFLKNFFINYIFFYD